MNINIYFAYIKCKHTLNIRIFQRNYIKDYDDMKLTLEDLYMNDKQDNFEKILEWRKENIKVCFAFQYFRKREVNANLDFIT